MIARVTSRKARRRSPKTKLTNLVHRSTDCWLRDPPMDGLDNVQRQEELEVGVDSELESLKHRKQTKYGAPDYRMVEST